MINPLNNYIKNYNALPFFKELHVGGAVIACVVGSILGTLAYTALTQGLLPLSLGQAGSIAASASTALLITDCVLLGLILHYASKIADKQSACNEESFLKALMATQALQDDKIGRLLQTLLRSFPDAKWKGLMHSLDGNFFGSHALYNQEVLKPILTVIFKACPLKVIELYCEEATLSDAFRTFIQENYIVGAIERLKGMSAEKWSQQLIYFADIKDTEEKYRLFGQLAEHDPNKFFAAYLTARSSCPQSFCEQMEEKVIYQETVMKAVWGNLYELNPTYFILKYFELKAKNTLSSEKPYDDQLLDILVRQTFQDWSQLLKGVDALYFTQEGEEAYKTALIAQLHELDRDKFLEAFQAAYFDFSDLFIKFIENFIKD